MTMALCCASDANLAYRQANSPYLSLVVQCVDILKATERLCMRLKLSVDLRILWGLIFSPRKAEPPLPEKPGEQASVGSYLRPEPLIRCVGSGTPPRPVL